MVMILYLIYPGNIHVLWGEWLHTITQAIQIAMATQTLDSFVTSVKRDIGEGTVGHVLSGDFNAEPHFPLYHLLSEGELCEGQSSRLQTVDYIKWSSMTQEPPETVSQSEHEPVIMNSALVFCIYKPLSLFLKGRFRNFRKEGLKLKILEKGRVDKRFSKTTFSVFFL